LKLLFEADKTIAELIFNYILAEDFATELNRELFEIIKVEFENNASRGLFTTSGLISVLKDEAKELYVRELSFDKHSVSGDWEDRFPSITAEVTMLKYAKYTVLKFLIEKIDGNIHSNRREIELAEKEEDVLQLMKANNELESEKRSIKIKLGNK
jgi:hypothetical protein